MQIEKRIQTLGVNLPVPPSPVANFIPVSQSGNIVYVSGQGPIVDGEPQYTGRLGEACTIMDGYRAAEICGVNLLAHLKLYLGDLDRINKILKATVYVASTPDFFDQPQVANGFSDMMVRIFGEKGRHTRCAVGLSSLPNNIPVEIDLTVEVT